MPGPKLIPVISDPALPGRVDVVVIGGGIIGAATAMELAERGISVLLCEKGEIGGEQSSRNWGWVRISCRDPREIPLMIESIRAWEGMNERTGCQTGYRQTGILFAAGTDKAFDQYQAWSENLRPHQIECGMVSGSDLDRVLPGHRLKLKGGLMTPIDGRAEPQWAAPAMAEAARRRGAAVVTGCAVRSVDQAAGRVAGVVTELGRVACDAVVLAGGAWSRLFAGNAGVDLPQLKVLNTVMRTTPISGGPEAALSTDAFAMRKRADGGYTVASGNQNTVDIVPDLLRLAPAFWCAFRAEWRSLRFRVSDRWRIEAAESRRWLPDVVTPFEKCRVLDPTPLVSNLKSSWAAARSAFPALQSAGIAQTWAGLIDVTPDAIPVISEVEAMPGFFVATGFSGHGFGIAPGAGRLMADLVTGAKPCVDPQDFRFSRFADGSRIHLVGGF